MLDRQTPIHLIGIGGTGLSAIARVLLESGYRVSGSDRQLSPLAQGLQQAGAQVYLGHDAANVHGVGLVIRSSAIPDGNPEVQEARRLGIPVLKRADFLGEFMSDKLGIAVAGSHGKTTTTAMIAWLFSALGKDPSFIIGGVSANLGVNAHAGKGRYFVIEADEYDRMFHGLKPVIAVVTNIEHDHPDCFPTPQDFYQAFVEFAQTLPEGGALIICADHPGAAQLARDCSTSHFTVYRYGLKAVDLDYRAEQVVLNSQGCYSFETCLGDVQVHTSMQVPGLHNVYNGLAALSVAHRCGLEAQKAAQALSQFQGTGRRFEILGEAGGVTVIDDYAHHPSEIQATLLAARQRFSTGRLWVVWQPHTYSRTRALLEAFGEAFTGADQVIVTDIYASREAQPADGFSARQVVDHIHHPQVIHVSGTQQTANFLLERLQPGDILLVLSAGDADQISHLVLSTLKERKRAYVE